MQAKNTAIPIKWITPSSEACIKNGGKVDPNNICLADWESAKRICSAAEGRLLSINELKSAVTSCGGKIDEYNSNKHDLAYQSCYKRKGFFPTGRYWSSYVFEALEENTQVVYFEPGYTNYTLKTNEGYVRCVGGR